MDSVCLQGVDLLKEVRQVLVRGFIIVEKSIYLNTNML